jgi:hypothetical protein
MFFSTLEFIAFAFGIAYIAYMAVMTDQYRRLYDGAFFRSQLLFGGVLAGLWLFLGVAFLPLLMPVSFLLLFKAGDMLSFMYRRRHLVLVNHSSIAEDSGVKVGISDVLLTAFVLAGSTLGVPYLLNLLLGWA